MAETLIIVPCYNEAERLDAAEFERLAQAEGVRLLFVNDGSTDATEAVLAELCERAGDGADWFSLEANSGKAEAVRRGLLQAVERTKGDSAAHAGRIVGYADADLSTPVDEILSLRDVAADRPEAEVIMGARVALSGREIIRDRQRHYLGRVFSTAASIILGATVYDTQCGAKFFRVTDNLIAALSAPFHSRWAFDVELLGRLLAGAPGTAPTSTDAVVEVPLRRWRDVGGSKLKKLDMVRAALELGVIARELRKWRRRSRGGR